MKSDIPWGSHRVLTWDRSSQVMDDRKKFKAQTRGVDLLKLFSVINKLWLRWEVQKADLWTGSFHGSC